MAIVRAIRNPNSQASLYGNTSPGDWNSQEQDFFIQNADGTYSDKQGNPVDFSKLIEQSYNNADGIQGGQQIYQDPSTFVRAENPVWWDEFVKPSIGTDFADSGIYSNPQLNQLNTDVQKQWLDKYRPNRNDGNLLTDLAKVLAVPLAVGGGMAFLGGLGGAGAAGAAGAGGYGAADALGLAQMGQAAGLSGSALADFVASGGTLGSTAAGGGGIGFGALSDATSTAADASMFNDTSVAGPAPGVEITPYNPALSGVNPGLVGTPLAAAGGLTSALGAAGSAAGSATQSALQRFMNGTATAADYASLLGTVGATALGAYSANQQTNDLKDLNQQYMGFGAPSRARYEASFQPGFNIAQADPSFQALKDQTSDSLLRRLSATSGNPYGSPGGLIEANKQIGASLDAPWLQNYRNQNAATSGIAGFSAAAPGAATAAIGSQGNALTNVAGGLSGILNPKPASLTLADLLKLGGANKGFSLV